MQWCLSKCKVCKRSGLETYIFNKTFDFYESLKKIVIRETLTGNSKVIFREDLEAW